MIDEATLANLLTEHAMAIPVPESAIADLLAASPRAETSALSRFTRPSGRMLAAAALVTLVVAGGVWALGAHTGGRASSDVHTEALAPAPPTTAAGAVRELRSTGPAHDALPPGATGGVTAAPSGSPRVSNSTSAPAASTKAVDSARIVRTGTLDLRVKRHTFGQTVGRITTIAAAAGGFISDEKTDESAAVPSGTVTIRVPSARFNATVELLRALGTVTSASTRGVDVTGQYVDLGARLAAATATRDQYLTVLAHATNIGDILAVQDRIQGVQTQIEQLQGQLNELNNQTTYGTITASVSEPAPTPKPPVRPHHESGVAVAWGNARHGFSQRVEGIISHSGSVLVVALSLLLLGGALRLLLPRARRLLV
jgi:Domain of unknown function (DUF4349)